MFRRDEQKVESAPMLAIPDTTKAFKVYCDLSYQGMGYVLSR